MPARIDLQNTDTGGITESVRVPPNRPANAKSWEIPFSREGLAFLGEIPQLKVRDARSISPSGLELE